MVPAVVFIQLPPQRFAFEEPPSNIPLAAGFLVAALNTICGKSFQTEIVNAQISDTMADAGLAAHLAGKMPAVLAMSLYVWNARRSLYPGSACEAPLPRDQSARGRARGHAGQPLGDRTPGSRRRGLRRGRVPDRGRFWKRCLAKARQQGPRAPFSRRPTAFSWTPHPLLRGTWGPLIIRIWTTRSPCPAMEHYSLRRFGVALSGAGIATTTRHSRGSDTTVKGP